MLLEARGIMAGFDDTSVLRGASLGVDDGEVVSIMGRSGSGKTTLLLCLAGLLRPAAGTVLFDGQDLGGMSERARSALRLRSFGFVFQFGDLVPELTIAENVALPLEFLGQDRRGARRAALESLAPLGIEVLADRRTFEVSGGEQQRAAVARALVHGPRAIFADEPTGSLDEVTAEQVLRLLLASARDRGCAVVLVTHDPVVAAEADRTVRLQAGVVAAPDTSSRR